MPHPPQLLELDVMSVHVEAHTMLGALHFLGSLGRGGVNLELIRVVKIKSRTAATIRVLNMLKFFSVSLLYNLEK